MRTAEEALTIPPDEPVLIELTADSSGVTAPGAEPELKPAEIKVAEEPVVEKVEPEETSLQKQLEDMKKAEAAAREREASAIRQRDAAIQAANQHGEAHYRSEGAREQAQYDAVLNAIGAAESEANRAEGDYATAMANSDFVAAAAAQRRLSVATTRLVQLEDGKAAFESRQEPAKYEPIRPQASDPIDANPNLSGRQKEWLKGHRDAQTDPAQLARLGAAHWDALKANHAQDSDAYFQFLEERLGYRQVAMQVKKDEIEDASTQYRSMPMSAPVTRESPSINGGSVRPTQVTLSAAQREAARISDVDDVTYAKNFLRLQELKKNGHYQERG